MSLSKSVKAYCLWCAESQKEVSLCPCFDCPLWPFRTGFGPGSGGYKRRMQAAVKNYPQEIAGMKRDGVEIARFSEAPSCRNRTRKIKSPSP